MNKDNKMAVWLLIGLIIGALIGYLGSKSVTGPVNQVSNSEISNYNPSQFGLKQTMRKLWADHVIWTREYIMAAVSGSAEVNKISERLMKNQEDIGNAIRPYYGKDAAEKLAGLLKEHITTAVDVVVAAKANDTTKFNEASNRWTKNAESIANFLSSANPNWQKQQIIDMLKDHLTGTTQEVQAIIGQKWDQDIAAFDNVFNQAMQMADGLSDGIIKQFPNKF